MSRLALERVVIEKKCAKKEGHRRGMGPEIGDTQKEERTKRYEPPGNSDKLIPNPFADVGEKQENGQRTEQGRNQPFNPQPGAQPKQPGPSRIVFRESAAPCIIHRIRGHKLVEWMRPVV